MKELITVFLFFNTLLFSSMENLNKDYFKNISFYNLQGEETKIVPIKKTLINFTTTWCPKCHQEKSTLKNIDSEKVDVILVFLQSRSDDPKKVKEYCEENELKFNAYYDFNRKLMNGLKIKSVPTNVLLDKNGKIIEVLEDSYLKLKTKI